MGLSESSLKPFSFLSHCKVSCDSPCCASICGPNNHCNFNIIDFQIDFIIIVPNRHF